ncbi:MAG: KH domain-containing protein [bacterium]|nr:KH domain-containing protein [bacterium]
MEKLLHYVASALVEFPERIRIEKEGDRGEQVYTLYLAPEDLGRMIGRHGKTAEALRTLLSAVGRKEDWKVNLRIRELE